MLSTKCFIMCIWGPAAFLFSRPPFTRRLAPHSPVDSRVGFSLDGRLCKASLLSKLQSMARPSPRWGHLCHGPPNNAHRAGRQSPTASAPRRPRIPGSGHSLSQNRLSPSSRLLCFEEQTLSLEGRSAERRRGCCSHLDCQAKVRCFCSRHSPSAPRSHRQSRIRDIPVHSKVLDSEALGGRKTTPLHSGTVKPRVRENAKSSTTKEERIEKTVSAPSSDANSSFKGSPLCFSGSTSLGFFQPPVVGSLSVACYHPFSSSLSPLRPLFSCPSYSSSFHFAQKTCPGTPRLAAPASRFSFSSSLSTSLFCQSSPSSIPSPSLASPSPVEPPAFNRPMLKQPLSRTAFDERKVSALAPIYSSDETYVPVHPVADVSSPFASSMSPPLSFRGPRSRSSRRVSSAGKDLDAPGTEEIRPAVGGPRDRSRKGSVDKEILPLLNQLNALENFYTSSSCSGRVLLLGIPKEDCNAVTSCCSIPLNTAQSPVTRSLPSPDESGLSNVLAFGSSLNSAASASSSAGHPASSSPAASPSCAVSSRPRSSTARDEAFTRDYLKDGSDKREGRRRQKHSKVFILNHHEEVTAQLLLQAIRACPLRCEEIWLKVEAPILHVCCRTLHDALSLVKVARPYAHRAVLLHVSSASSSDGLRIEAEGDPSSMRKEPQTEKPVLQLRSLKSKAASPHQDKLLQSTVDSPAVSPAGGHGASAARLPESSCPAADDLRGSAPTGNGEEKIEPVSVRNQPGASYSGPRNCIKQNEKKTGSGRKKNSGRFVVELTGSVQLAMPVLLSSDRWIVPLPTATKDRTQSLQARRNGSTAQSLGVEAGPTDDADGEGICQGDKHEGKKVGVDRSDAALEARDIAGRLLPDDTLNGDAEIRKRWECLAQLCNEGLHESRKKFMGLMNALEKLAETAACAPSDEEIR